MLRAENWSDSALQASGFAQEQLRYLSRKVDAPSGDPVIATSGRAPHRRHALIERPHCGGRASHSVVTPEKSDLACCAAAAGALPSRTRRSSRSGTECRSGRRDDSAWHAVTQRGARLHEEGGTRSSQLGSLQASL